MRPPSPTDGDVRGTSEPADTAPTAKLSQVMGAVLWSFFGVRKGKAMRRDAVTIRPHQVILVGLVAAAAFVAILLVLVRVIVSTAG